MYELTQIILKGLGKPKVKSILKKWLIDQVNLNLECDYYNFNGNAGGDGGMMFDTTIRGYGLPVIDEDHDYYVNELFEFVGNKI